MKNNKKPSVRMRFLAWMMAAIMMCTGLNVTAYAQELSFDDGYALEQQEEQVTEEGTAEEIQQYDAEDESISDTEISFEDSQDNENTDEDETTVEEIDTDDADTETVDTFSDADAQNTVEAFSDGSAETREGTATATVYFSFSHDAKYLDGNYGQLKTPAALTKLTVPYFDLAKYGLEKYYFASTNYDSSGVAEGTAETAYNKVTMLHVLIYATEVLYLDLPKEQAGKGYLKENGYLDDGKTFNITGKRGSVYLPNLWSLDKNFNYYLNYEYPLASEGWGGTCDQILVENGDIISVAHFTSLSFFGDSAFGFNYLKAAGNMTEATVDRKTVEEIPIEIWRAQSGMEGGGTVQNPMKGEYQVFYTSVSDMLDGDVESWNLLGTTTNGTLNVDVDSLPNGKYFVAIPGQPGAEDTKSICSCPGGIYLNVTGSAFEGQGTEASPYQLSTAEDLTRLKKLVKAGMIPENTYFVLTDDITLPEGWTPIGETIDGTNNIKSGANLRAFSGILDGKNHTITVPEGGLPLIGYVKGAEIRNLNIYGTKIAGYGLINNLEGVGLHGKAVLLDNITLKSGSSTLKSGLLGANITTNQWAGCTADFLATVQNCTIEDNVVIGYDKDQSIIGSFAGRFIGTINNCTSNATVYGVNYVGGIIGMRDNSMGDNYVTKCTFGGTVEASGKNAGGIVAGGYMDNFPEDYAWGMSAPNGYRLNVNGCTSTGSVTGADNVGGIFGGDILVAQAWNAYTFKNNIFTGMVSATNGTNVGGIIGYYRSLNKFDDIEGNTYCSKTCGAAKGIGGVEFVDTNYETHETESGATYFNTANGTNGLPSVKGCAWRGNHNRTDDPLGADAEKLTASHVWDEGVVTKEPTCKETGVKTYTCSGCGATKTEEIAKTDKHIFDEGKVTKEATCKEAGEKTYTCTVCEATKTEEIPMKEHTYDAGVVTKEPTCKETGVKTYTCSGCGDTRTEEIAKTDKHIFDEGKVTKEATCKEAGVKTYTCTVCGATKTEAVAKTADHNYTWKTVSEATVFEAEKQQGTCSVCGTTVTKENGTKLVATIKLNATSITLQQKQSTNKIRVTMANGDSVKSWTSDNKKIVTVNDKGVIKAGKKNGTAKITVTLASGKKAVLKVKVQKAKVKTTKISGLKSKAVLNKGQKLTLKPVISPLTSQDKVIYTSSNKKVATVNKSGVITAKKKGTAKIKVKSGNKSYTVKVTVK